MADEISGTVSGDATAQSLRQAIRRELSGAGPSREEQAQEKADRARKVQEAESTTPERGQNLDITV